MSYTPTPDEAMEILQKYNKEEFHLEHARTVSKVLGYLARERDPGREDFWRSVGLLHDIDFELYPDEHCKKAVEILAEHDIDADMTRAIICHGYGICSDVAPEHIMEKFLFATDELTGLIGAAALMRPTGMSDLETKSVVKKFKTKAFAAGCSREVIQQGADMLGMPLNELITITLEAMKSED